MKLSALFTQYGFFPYVAVVFLAFGLLKTSEILWGLIMGGPRNRSKPGAPYLFDRVYYLLFAVGMTSWWICLLAFAVGVSTGDTDRLVTVFMVGWAIGAIAMGLLFGLRGDMWVEGSRYLAKHGFPPFRVFHALQARQFDRVPIARKLIPIVFPLMGLVALAINFSKVPMALEQTWVNLHLVWNFLSKLQLA
jgi:hypothetical protein